MPWNTHSGHSEHSGTLTLEHPGTLYSITSCNTHHSRCARASVARVDGGVSLRWFASRCVAAQELAELGLATGDEEVLRCCAVVLWCAVLWCACVGYGVLWCSMLALCFVVYL